MQVNRHNRMPSQPGTPLDGAPNVDPAGTGRPAVRSIGDVLSNETVASTHENDAR